MINNNMDTFLNFIENKEVREKLKLSEHRIRKTYNELFSGYNLKPEKVLNEVVKVKNYSGIVCVQDISFYTFCEHHFLPFFGKANVYYEPNKIITGLGKIVRLVKDVHGRRLQIQEIMTKNIAEDIYSILNAKGVFVETKATHLCICGRGPHDDNSFTSVTYSVGTLKKWHPKK